jgi:hypothetical protein
MFAPTKLPNEKKSPVFCEKGLLFIFFYVKIAKRDCTDMR